MRYVLSLSTALLWSVALLAAAADDAAPSSTTPPDDLLLKAHYHSGGSQSRKLDCIKLTMGDEGTLDCNYVTVLSFVDEETCLILPVKLSGSAPQRQNGNGLGRRCFSRRWSPKTWLRGANTRSAIKCFA